MRMSIFMVGVAVVLAACGGGSPDEPAPSHRMALPSRATAAVAVFQVQAQPSGECLSASGGALAWAACGDAFELVPGETGASRGALRHAASGLCAAASGGALLLAACDGSSAQTAFWRDDGEGNRQVRLPNAGARGAWVDQLFRLVAVAGAAGWQPAVTDTWQWQLTGTINTSYDALVYDIDLFEAPQSVIDGLKASGRRVVCYFSAGSSEDWRGDFGDFNASDMGNNLDGWPGERWLDTRSANVRNIMKARLEYAVTRGCDGVEPDNMDGYLNDPGLPLTRTTQLDYNRFIGEEARARGLKVGLKNAVDLLAQLEPYFDFAVNEQCHQYDECDGYSVFTTRGKPVFNAEYASKWRTDANKRAQLCAASAALDIRTLVLPLGLDDSFRYACD